MTNLPHHRPIASGSLCLICCALLLGTTATAMGQNTTGRDWEYGWHYDPVTNDWEYGWSYSGENEDYAPSDPYSYMDYGTYFNPLSGDWEHGWHYRQPGRTQGATGDTSDRGRGSPTRRQPDIGTWQRRLNGTIQALRVRDIGGVRHLVGTVETPENRRVNVDFGPRYRVDSLDLEVANAVTVLGRLRRLQGREMFAAETVLSAGQYVVIGRDGDRRRNPDDRRQRPEQPRRHIEGDVIELYARMVNGRNHLWAEMQTVDDRMVDIDLGPRRLWRGVDLTEGDRIDVVGHRRSIQGRVAIEADRVRTDDSGVVVVTR